MKEIAEMNNYETVGDLQENYVCCLHCELCKPYIEEMFLTGETEFKPKPYPVSEFPGRKTS